MLRTCLCSAAVLALFTVGLVRADDAKTKADAKTKKHEKATVTKVDPQKESITVKMMDKSGKEVEDTIRLTSAVKLLDCSGKSITAKSFEAGDEVFICRNGSAVTEVKKAAQATITKVDAAKGTVTVRMTDKDGKQVEKTFQLAEDAEYLDSTGRVATVDVFRSGDEILIVEGEGKVTGVKKMSDKEKADSSKKSGEKK
jgi:uncharacterized protein YigE (DUF2233 family)